MKRIVASTAYIRWAPSMILLFLLFSGCRKQSPQEQLAADGSFRPAGLLPKKNPFSLRNILAIKEKFSGRRKPFSRYAFASVPDSQQLLYVKIDPEQMTTELVRRLDEDSTVTLLDFPFAHAGMYDESFALDEYKVAQLKDGFLYAVLPLQNQLLISANIPFVPLDTLYKPLSDEDPLVEEALVEGGYITREEAAARICFRRPEGFVRYRDSERGMNQPVVGIQVFAIAFGVPVHTYSNETGWFRINWRFLYGSLIGTKAKNPRVNIKPIVTHGIWLSTIIPQFLVGAVHMHGFVSSCRINQLDIRFDAHRQNRFWAHILNAVHDHDKYQRQDDILQAPDKLTIWAHWADEYGGSGAPMLGHIPGSPLSVITQYIRSLLGVDITHYPNLFNTLLGGLPDITLRSGSAERVSYSSDQMQAAFHELAHAGHYRAVGNEWWKDFMWSVAFPSGNCGGYGCGNGTDDGLIQLAEAWAEFLGTFHARKRYPGGYKRSHYFRTYVNPEGLVRLDHALENEFWYRNDWIPTGIFNDLMDKEGSPDEPWDTYHGATIRDLFSPFAPDIRTPCAYNERFIQLQGLPPGFQPVQEIFFRHGVSGCAK